MPQRDPAGLVREFAAQLEELVAAAGYSRRDLERATGINKSTIQDALSGRSFPRQETVLAIVRACGASEQSWRAAWMQVRLARNRSGPVDQLVATPERPDRLPEIAEVEQAPTATPRPSAHTARASPARPSRLVAVTIIVALSVGLLAIGIVLAGRLELFHSASASVPPLVGRHPAQACADLRAVGLTCTPRNDEVTREINVVHTQSHPAGTRLAKGTAVQYTYQTARALPLLRYQAPPPASANVISPTEPGPPGWHARSPLGLAYPAGEDRVPGLIPIYRYRCAKGCREPLVYWLSRRAGRVRNWAFEQEAFRCFDPDAPPRGTRPLHSLVNDRHARAWAVPGTGDYQDAIASGFDPRAARPLCYIW